VKLLVTNTIPFPGLTEVNHLCPFEPDTIEELMAYSMPFSFSDPEV
jgi:hypothetical protein